MGYTISWNPQRFTDYTYNTILTLTPTVIKCARFDIYSWGFVIGENEDDSFAVSRDGNEIPFAKTNRLPYTKDAMKVLILMVEYGATSELDHDDEDMRWYLEALDEVHSIKPLMSYQQQKDYFIKLEANKRITNSA